MKAKKHRLGELCRMVKGTSPTMKTEPGPYPLVVTAAFRRTANTWQLEGPAVCIPLVSSTGHGDAALHRVHYQEGKFALANLLVALLPKDPLVCDAKYLYHLLMTQKDELLVLLMQGTANVSLKEQDIADVEIPLPPLAEQRRVVARIEALATQINEVRTLRHQAAEETEALHLSVLNQHFVGEALAWTPMPMDEAVEINDKQVDPTLPDYAQLPHISGENMEGKTCRLLPWRTAETDGVKSNNYLFSPGTILYSKIRPYLRKAVFVNFRGVCSADIYPVRVKSPKLDPHFVKWAFVAEPFTEYANRLSGRTRMPKLNRKQLFGFGFSPPPLAEQRRIVAELDALQAEVDALKRLQAETAAELAALLPAILDRAFKGEL